ncbi:EAL domain-containing protein [Methylomonas sp. AM2-LC]|uniref:two-component system response regulator n=1 Tax=Methylomonas sp. AM2-LC TaxID=3153301 RepID=UPI0032660A9D
MSTLFPDIIEKHLVLLVDDLPANLHVLVAGIKKYFRIKAANNGYDALALLEQTTDQPKLAVIDVKMPNMSGIELLRRIRSTPHCCNIPVILMSADVSEQNELAALQLGADDYLVKPVSPNVLVVRANNLIQRNADRIKLQLAAHVFDFSGEAIMITDRNNHIVDVNSAFTTLTGYAKEDVLGYDPKILSSGRTSPEEYKLMWQSILNDGFWQGEFWDRRKDGSVYPKMITITVVRNPIGDIIFYLANFVDVSHYKEVERRFEYIANHDPLTGLPNRLHLQVFLEQCTLISKRTTEQIAILFLDLDRFKSINDTLGHYIGDQMLIQVADRLKSCIREYDMVARIGGDEFVVVLRGYQLNTVSSAVAEKIRHHLCTPFHVNNQLLHTSPSIGIAIFPDNAENIHDLMKHADTAMYFTKSEGGNGFHFFATEMNKHAHEKLELENQLHRAIDNQQFELYYQPQLSLPERKVVGAEVLLRWLHPEKGYISPALFIPLAEDSNQIGKITEWVLENACQQASEWLVNGLPLQRISVNISAKQFQNMDILGQVKRLLVKHNLPAHMLELEITETALIASADVAKALIQSLRELGIKVALDDFGQGYSSLAQLKNLPLDRIKIDAAFVQDIQTYPAENTGIIAAATIGLGHSFGFEVIAEGVESEIQLAFLEAHGCDEIQGYLFSKPLPKHEFESYLQRHMQSVALFERRID